MLGSAKTPKPVRSAVRGDRAGVPSRADPRDDRVPTVANPSVANAAVYQAVSARRRAVPRVTDKWRSSMTWRRAVTSAGDDVESVIDPTIDRAKQATDECEEFSFEP
jgi:hypothetical protein